MERFRRITDEKNHYYTYVYAALYLRQIETQWRHAGFDIADKPGVLSTLYNIGFTNSHPNASPRVGGSAIFIGERTYSFGGLADEFYNSETLLSAFPKQ